MNRICLVDDEESLLDIVSTFLSGKGLEVDTYHSPETFLNHLKDGEEYEAYVLDWKMPGTEGTELVSKIRKLNQYVPVFMLTGCNGEDEMLTGLNSGVDDYITKPCNLENLHARLKNAIKKYSTLKLSDSELKIIEEGNVVTFQGNSTSLTSREFAIFKVLFEYKGKPVNRDNLLKSLQRTDSEMIKRNVDVHVFSLRKKLMKINLEVKTIRGIGYQLELV